MARLFGSTFGGSLSGAMGGQVFSRNRYGAYMRSRVKPVNPKTVLQTAIRNSFSSLSNGFLNSLTAEQRTAWEQYAAAVPVRTKKGTMERITGQNMYVRCNQVRLNAGLAELLTAPVIQTGAETDPTANAAIVASTHTLSASFNDALEWANEAGGSLMVYMAAPRSASRKYNQQPFRFVGRIEGGAVTPPTSPTDFTTLPWIVAAGDVVRVRFRVARNDGRISDTFGEVDVVAS